MKQFIDKMQVFSARPIDYTNYMHTNWILWKELKFNLCFNKFFQFPFDLITKHIISIGDGIAEINAATSLGMYRDKTFIKTVKLGQTPSLSQMEDEYAFLHSCYEYILNTNKHLDVKIFDNTMEIFASTTLI